MEFSFDVWKQIQNDTTTITISWCKPFQQCKSRG